MKRVLDDWITKAEGDYRAAIRLHGPGAGATHDAVCFHCQQCVEKYLKALCTLDKIRFEKGHNLLYLLGLLQGVNPSLELFRTEFQNLTAMQWMYGTWRFR
ncbi:MAG: HEPN domain-containing protein [Ignavibacteria bacterium]|nr:HEPN domain-containing protein [Ignavibacteria bacterium]